MGSEGTLLPGGGEYFEQSSILRDARHRRIISILLDRSHPMTLRDLAVQLAAHEAGTTPSAVPGSDYKQLRIELHHRYLPKLEAVGWIERRPEGVTAAEPVSTGGEDSMLPDLREPDHPAWDAVAALLARPRRLELVSIVGGERDRLHLEDLAAELAARGPVTPATERYGDEPTVRSTLHHVDLPRLAEVGLIDYDPEEQTVTRTRTLVMLLTGTDLGPRVTEESVPD